jgi:hypothetical protein
MWSNQGGKKKGGFATVLAEAYPVLYRTACETNRQTVLQRNSVPSGQARRPCCQRSIAGWLQVRIFVVTRAACFFGG